VLLGNATAFDGIPAAFEAGPEGRPVLVIGGLPLNRQ
jgi:hypothetical protein